jgi:hypothetical protein
MEKINKNILLFILLIAFFSSCTDDFNELNTDPNRPVDVPPSTILRGIIVQTAKMSDNRIPNYFSQTIAQNFYFVEDRYKFPYNDLKFLWENYYGSVFRDAEIIKTLTTENPNMWAAAELLEIYGYHVLTDVFGDIPYSEALKADEGNYFPKYDSQKDIYTDLLKRLAVVNSTITTSDPIEGDILFNGDPMKWKKFGNALRMRMAIRMSFVNTAESKRIVEEILASPETYPLPESNNDNAMLSWTETAPYQNSWYVEYLGGLDGSMNAVSKVMVDYLKLTDDPRLFKYATPAKFDSTYTGATNGPVIGEEEHRDHVSRVGEFWRNDPTLPTKILTYPEVLFCIAESGERGWNIGSFDAKTAYEEGIINSCLFVEIPRAEGESLVQNPEVMYVSGSTENNLEKIYYQKWVDFFLQGWQSWATVRRTDVPLLLAVPGTIFPGEHNRAPFRVAYPDTEENYNPENWLKAAESAGIIKDSEKLWGKQLWWDTRTGVN